MNKDCVHCKEIKDDTYTCSHPSEFRFMCEIVVECEKYEHIGTYTSGLLLEYAEISRKLYTLEQQLRI